MLDCFDQPLKPHEPLEVERFLQPGPEKWSRRDSHRNQKCESCWKRPHRNHDKECRQSLGAGLGPSSQPARKWALWYYHHKEMNLANKLVNFKADFFLEPLVKKCRNIGVLVLLPEHTIFFKPHNFYTFLIFQN